MAETESQFEDSEIDDEDCTSGGDFLAAVNGIREVRDRMTGFVEGLEG